VSRTGPWPPLVLAALALAGTPVARADTGGKGLVDAATPAPAVPEAEQAFFEANRLLQSDRAAEAIPLYEKALALDPGLHRVRYYLAQALHEVGRNAAALEVLDGYLSSPIGDRERSQAFALRTRIAPTRPPLDEGGPRGADDPEAGRPNPRQVAAEAARLAYRREAIAGGVVIGTGVAASVAGLAGLTAARDLAFEAVDQDDAALYGQASGMYAAGLVVAISGGVALVAGTVLLVHGGTRAAAARVSASPGGVSFALEF